MQLSDTNNRQKFIIVTPWYGSFAGGAEVLARQLSENLVKRGFFVKVFCTLTSSPYEDWWLSNYNLKKREKINDVVVHRYEVDKSGKKRYQEVVQKKIQNKDITIKDEFDFFYSGISSKKLIVEIKKYLDRGWRIIALPYFQSLTHCLVEAYPKMIEIISCLHDEEEFYWKPVEKLLNNSRSIFFNSQEEKLLAIKIYGNKIGNKIFNSPVIGVGVNIPKTSFSISKKINLPNRFILYMGRKEKGKNVHILVKWHKEYCELLKNPLPLVFVGGGDTDLIPNDPFFIDLQYVDEEIKNYVISKSSCLVNLSKNESFSYVIMESWLESIPVIVNSNCAVTSGHVKRSGGGFCVGNSNSYAAALKAINENLTLSKKMGRFGNKYVLKNYSWDNVIERIVNI